VSGWTPRIRRVEASDGEQLQYANSLLRAGRFDEAQAEAVRFLAGHEGSPAAQLTLGLAFLGRRQVDDALSCFTAAMARDPLQPQPLLAAGFAYLQKKEGEQAEQCFREALNLDTDLPGGWLGLAQACDQQGRTDEARQHLTDLLARHPEMTVARLLLARLHRKAGDAGGTAGQIDALLARNPGQAGIAGLLPVLFRFQSEHSKFEDSIRLLEAATRFNPASAIAWSWLGRARLQAGRHVEAEAAFREALRLKGGALAAAIGLAEALIAQRRLDEARAILRDVPRRRPVVPLLERACGDICFAERVYEEAARHYCAALMALPGGRELIAAAEKDVPGTDSASEVLAERYRAALTRATDMAKARLAEQDWQALGRRYAQAAWRSRGDRPAAERASS
jgi:predicted Zn-dependent protease